MDTCVDSLVRKMPPTNKMLTTAAAIIHEHSPSKKRLLGREDGSDAESGEGDTPQLERRRAGSVLTTLKTVNMSGLKSDRKAAQAAHRPRKAG